MLIAALFLACSPAPEPGPAAPGTPAEKPTLQTVRVGLNWYPEPEFGGFYEALVSGAYERAGLDVELIPGGPGTPVLEMLQAGRLEVAVSGADDLLVRRAKGLNAVAILPGLQDSPVGLMVHEGGPTRYEEVKGRVAIEAGSPFQAFLWKKYGWEGKIEMVPTTGTLGPFAADAELVQQAYITSEPCQAEDLGVAIAFLPGRDAGWNPYASLAVVQDASAPWVEAFHDASLQGWNDYLAAPERANAEIQRTNPNMVEKRLRCITEKQASYVTGKDGVGVMTQARWDAIAAALGQPPDPGAWVSLR